MKRKIFLAISLLVLFISVSLLASGSGLLTKPILSGLPFGTIITWAGLVSFPMSVLLGTSRSANTGEMIHRWLNKLIKINIWLALFWGFVGYFLAGNWAYVFKSAATFRGSVRASSYFWSYTLVLVVLPVTCLTIFMIYRIFMRQQRRD
ncbi:MAG TPA: hypothetical protein VHO50_08930 [Bacteroidales bacterium]|nr:hypothetical protein [Bacteroidales bacterium]